MPELEGVLRGNGRIGIVVSRYHERITSRLLDGARQACTQAAIPESHVDVLWVEGAFELGVVATAMAFSERYDALVALGVVIRGETPHFDFVAGETSATLARAAADALMPIGFGLLTCDTMEQALARAGGDAGNKGHEAAVAALKTANLLAQLGAILPEPTDEAR